MYVCMYVRMYVCIPKHSRNYQIKCLDTLMCIERERESARKARQRESKQLQIDVSLSLYIYIYTHTVTHTRKDRQGLNERQAALRGHQLSLLVVESLPGRGARALPLRARTEGSVGPNIRRDGARLHSANFFT